MKAIDQPAPDNERITRNPLTTFTLLVTVVLLPLACFATAEAFQPSTKMDWAGLIWLGWKATWIFYPFFLFGIVSSTCLLLNPTRFVDRYWVRLGTYSGIALSLYFTIVVFVGIAFPILISPFGLALPFVFVLPILGFYELEHSPWFRRPLLFTTPTLGLALLCVLVWGSSFYKNWPSGNSVLIYAGIPVGDTLICSPFWYFLLFIYLLKRANGLSEIEVNSNWQNGIRIVWFTSFLSACTYSILKGRQIYDSLPEGGCFVATAAAKGHPRFVGSHIARTGSGEAVPITQQLIALKTFENLLQARRPRAHRALRFAYNRIGPPLAACIVHPILADIAYLLLKPAEWFARGFISVAGNRLTVARRLTSRELIAKDPGK